VWLAGGPHILPPPSHRRESTTGRTLVDIYGKRGSTMTAEYVVVSTVHAAARTQDPFKRRCNRRHHSRLITSLAVLAQAEFLAQLAPREIPLCVCVCSACASTSRAAHMHASGFRGFRGSGLAGSTPIESLTLNPTPQPPTPNPQPPTPNPQTCDRRRPHGPPHRLRARGGSH
jgi:hypothetical protein